MENKLLQTPSFTPKPPAPAEDRGAGGKFRKPPSRRPPSTPYSRPPQNQSQPRGGRWLSKLVDPAYRLITGSANLIFPSFFSKLDPANARPENLDNLQTDLERNSNAGINDVIFENLKSKATGAASTSNLLADISNTHSEFTVHEHDQNVEVSHSDDGISRIEQLLKDKTFSRDEINCLIEILNSRVVDVLDDVQQNKCLGTPAGDSGRLIEAKKEHLSRSNSKNKEREHPVSITADNENHANAFDSSRKLTEEIHEDSDRGLWRSSSPLPQSKPQGNVGTSPVELARAYMENRLSEVGFGTNSLLSKDDGTMPRDDENALKSYFPSPGPKSSPCWPGASVQDQRGYMTPQSQRGRFGLHNFPRTPYSRNIYTKTKSRSIQLQGSNARQPSIISTPFQQTRISSFEQINSRDKANDGHGSVGPMRRIRNKATAESPSRGSTYFSTSLKRGQVENFSVSEGLFSAPRMNLENGGTDSTSIYQSMPMGGRPHSSEVCVLGCKPQSSEVSVPTVPPHSSLVARKILEHLERNPPTPKDKSAELRLATSWKKSQSTDSSPSMPNKLNRLTRFGELDSSEKSIQIHKINSQDSSHVAINGKASTSDIKVGTASALGDYAMPSQDLRKSQDIHLMDVPKDASKVVANAAGSEVLNSQTLPPQSSSAKPALASISINKPNQKWHFSSDNGLGFTFPVSATSGGSSEPPTPSIMPSSAVIGQPQKSEGSSGQNEGTSQVQQNEGLSIPSYSFGSGRSTPALVFSFPSTSRTPAMPDDASDLKFKFGSEETARISFSSVGKDAICY